MSLAFRQFKVYLRIALVAAVLLFAVIVLFKNRHHTVSIWFFGLTDPKKPINVVWLILWTVFATQTASWLISFGHGLWREYRDMRREQAETAEKQRQEQRVAAIEERERRLEQMLRHKGGGEQDATGPSSGPASPTNQEKER